MTLRTSPTEPLAPVPAEPAHEDALLAGCRARDERAWSEVYRTLAPRLAQYLRRVLGPDPDVPDLVQQVFANAIAAADGFRGNSRLSTWLYGIATHLAERHGRWRFRKRRRALAYGDWLAAADERGADVSDGADARALLRALGEVVGALGPRHRAVWVMCEWERLPAEEVAAALGVPVGTVRSRLFHARRQVLEALRRSGADLAAAAAIAGGGPAVVEGNMPAGGG